MRFQYPAAARGPARDDYHGHAVADPYRWLEDPDSAVTRAFVAAQQSLTRRYLDGLPEVADLRRRLPRLWDVARTGTPQRRSGVTVWPHNDGLANQPVFWVQRADQAPRVLLDPNELSNDGTVSVMTWSLSPDGALMAYSLSDAGSDWQRIRIRSTADGIDLPDEIAPVKFTPIAWYEDGFYYSRFADADPESVGVPRYHAVWHHRVGAPAGRDAMVFRGQDPDPLHIPLVDTDGGVLIVEELIGTSVANGLWYRPLDGDGDGDGDGDFRQVVQPGIGRHEFLFADGRGLIVLTDVGAPLGRIVRLPYAAPTEPEILIAEGSEPLQFATVAAGRLALVRLVEAAHRIDLHALDGTLEGSISLDGPVTVEQLSGTRTEPDLFAGVTGFDRPPGVIRWSGGRAETFAAAGPPLDDLVVERLHAVSTDGAEVGMFLLRGPHTSFPAPTELYGYGGFNISLTPSFNPGRLGFVAAGGGAVIANLRGGSEKGEAWHEQGMLARKQQVFDDFVTCAGHLIDQGVTTAAQLGIHGRSNGGLLTAAVMLQRPDLFGAVVAGVPVTDMLRYQEFTAGKYWTVEFGDGGEDPEAFAWLMAYSPLHNVREDVTYPPTLITTAESDDRVVPMHALKFAAALQHAAGGASDHPLLVRIEERAGHGMGKPTAKLIEEAADVYGFLLHHLRRGG